jgi:hypothetical protein
MKRASIVSTPSAARECGLCSRIRNNGKENKEAEDMSEQEQALIGWAVTNNPDITEEQLRAFLFFYECFSALDGDAVPPTEEPKAK